jgi:hypothetical protein
MIVVYDFDCERDATAHDVEMGKSNFASVEHTFKHISLLFSVSSSLEIFRQSKLKKMVAKSQMRRACRLA